VPIFKKSLQYVDVIKKLMVAKKADITKAAMTAKQFDDFMLQLTSYTEGHHFFDERELVFNNTVENCLYNLIEARSNAVCLRCSGNFKIFYDKASGGIMASEQTCSQVIGNCSAVFAFNSEINTFYRRISQIK
jgi:hypothetical protein